MWNQFENYSQILTVEINDLKVIRFHSKKNEMIRLMSLKMEEYILESAYVKMGFDTMRM
jgi:hypothetical protein